MESKERFLADIPTGGSCYIVKVHGYGSFRNRILEMGFICGERVEVIKNAPLSDPIEYVVMGTHVSLRRSEAALIQVVSEKEEVKENYNGTFTEGSLAEEALKKGKTIEVALVGNPNSGKTSLFNHFTGLREHVGNYGGVTVDVKNASFKYKGYNFEMVDLPGTYSIYKSTAEEIFVSDYLTKNHPDIVLNVVDAGKLERNLFLTTQLIDMNLWVVMALNMYDELEASGAELDYHNLGHLLGFPIVPTVAHKGKGIEQLLDTIIEAYEGRAHEMRHIHIDYGQEIESGISKVKTILEPYRDKTELLAPRFLAIKCLEAPEKIHEQAGLESADEVVECAEKQKQILEKEFKQDICSILSDAKYGFIKGALKETYKEGEQKHKLSESIDNILTNKWLGYPCLLIFLWIMFQLTFTVGQYPMDWIEAGIDALSDWVGAHLAEGPLTDLLVDGILGGVGGVLVFLPNILILFFFISLMEDTGYMARAAFLMDRIMHKMGLHGQSFIPLLMGYGCNVPAIMATRTLKSRRDRILTILVVPFMSCNARLPIYLLLVGAFFVSHQGLVLLSIYLIGILLAVLSAFILGKFVLKQDSEPFVIELPPYRIPTFRNMLIHMWDKGKQYLKKMSTIILAVSIVIWALSYFPRPKDEEMSSSEQIEQSYIGRAGKFVEPVLAPLGFDWKMDVSVLTGLTAKEVVVSSLSILYTNHEIDEEDEEEETNRLAEELQRNSGFTPLIAYVFMIFMMLYIPCIATIVVIMREAGRKWGLFTLFYGIFLAWVVGFIIYQVGMLFG